MLRYPRRGPVTRNAVSAGVISRVSNETVVLLAILFFCAATLYSSVGHAGASGYLAVMSLVAVEPAIMKPTALVLNILVATIATLRYRAVAGDVIRQSWPFIAGSIPLALLGGAIHLPAEIYRPLVGSVLLIAGTRLIWTLDPHGREPRSADPSIPIAPAVASGAGIGFLSGLTGVGGGVFLSPLLIFTGWVDARSSAAIAALFIMVNSVAGLVGNVTSVQSLPGQLPIWLAAAFVGGLLGTEIGSRQAGSATLQRLLALILIVAGLRFLIM